jgi:hypothetical protein
MNPLMRKGIVYPVTGVRGDQYRTGGILGALAILRIAKTGVSYGCLYCCI